MEPTTPDKPVTPQADRPIMAPTLMPVTRLVSRPSVTIVNGRLSTVLELLRSAA